MTTDALGTVKWLSRPETTRLFGNTDQPVNQHSAQSCHRVRRDASPVMLLEAHVDAIGDGSTATDLLIYCWASR